ncbi:MAG: YfcC family protein [Clostridia bacterium]|nr:YfcC family protein [Clostridia bacterium]
MKNKENIKATQQTTASEGLTINKKTVASILLVLTAVLIFVGILTQVVPRGEYTIDADGAIVDGTYEEIPDYKMPLWKIAASPVLAFTTDNASTGIAILAILILVGGTFLILDRIGVLKYIMATIVKKFRDKRFMLIAVMVFAGMFLSSTAGILEESLTLVPIAVAISLAMGWDSLTGIGMSFVAVAFGFTAATFNPFNVITVQKLAGLEVFSGLWFRIVLFAAVYLSLTGFLILYAKRIEKHPEKSIAYVTDKTIKDKYSMDKCMPVLENPLVKKASHVFIGSLGMVLLGIAASFILTVVGNKIGNETMTSVGGVASLGCMAVFFPAGGLLAGAASGLKGKKLFATFGEGVKTILPVLPLIIFILAISYILDTGKIMHTLLFYINNMMHGISPYSAIMLMFLFIAILEFFVGSGTAKAFLIVPLMSMLCDLLGITRQSMVVVFCMADGFTNLLYPTSGLMILAIGMVGVSYKNWLKWSWKLFLTEGVVAVVFMVLAVALNYN